MEDNRELVTSLFGFINKNDQITFHYLLDSLASFEEDTMKRGFTPDGNDSLSFGELALVRSYALELVNMTNEFMQFKDESDKQVLDRVAKNCKRFRRL